MRAKSGKARILGAAYGLPQKAQDILHYLLQSEVIAKCEASPTQRETVAFNRQIAVFTAATALSPG